MLFKFWQFFITFFLKNYFFFSFKILFAVFNVLFVGYSLAKNNLNNTYQYMISKKKKSKTMNYLIILIKFKVSRFLCRSVYNCQCQKWIKEPILYRPKMWTRCITILPQIIVEVMFTSLPVVLFRQFIFKTNLMRNQEKSFSNLT
jgi:hypothetical protein